MPGDEPSIGAFRSAALEAKYLKEAPTVINGFLNLTHLIMVRVFFVQIEGPDILGRLKKEVF